MSLMLTQFENLCVVHIRCDGGHTEMVDVQMKWDGADIGNMSKKSNVKGLRLDGVWWVGTRGAERVRSRFWHLSNETASSYRCPWWASCSFWAYTSPPWHPVWEASTQPPGFCSALPRRKWYPHWPVWDKGWVTSSFIFFFLRNVHFVVNPIVSQ